MILVIPQISRPHFAGRAAAAKRATIPQIARPFMVLPHFVIPQIIRPHFTGRSAVRSAVVVGEPAGAPVGIPGRWHGVEESGIPQAWWSVVIPGGFICPLLAQLAMVRGEEADFEDETGRLKIGGRILVGTRGNEYHFNAAGDADLWVSINRARIASELALVKGMSPSASVVFKAAKTEKAVSRSETIMRNAANLAGQDVQAALAAEAQFYLTKWEW